MPALDIADVLRRLQRTLPTKRGFLALHEPVFEDNDRAYVLECLDSGWVSSVGKFVDRFERDLADFTGAKRAIAVVNGTAALHLALKLSGVQAGDEVLTPALSFVATANAISYCGAMPHFVDCDERTLGLDPQRLDAWLQQIATPCTDGGFRNRQTGARLAAVVPMHTFGHPVDLDGLMAVAERWQLPVIEDAAESLGSYYRGKHTGRYGLLGTLSFNGNKIITTGGGGAIITDDDALADRAKHLSTTAKVPHRWAFVHDEVGYNYRLPNLNAALGCAQLERLPRYLDAKRKLAANYREAFSGMPGLKFVDEPEAAHSNFWLNTLLLDAEHATHRDALLEATNAVGIMTRPAWTLMHRLPAFQHCPHMALDVAESLEARLINIPSSPQLLEPV